MQTLQHTTIEGIVKSTSRVYFGKSDINILVTAIKQFQAKGRQFGFHPMLEGSFEEAFTDGLIVLRANDLDVDFVLAKINAGKSFLGRQKSKIQLYVGTMADDELMPSVLTDGLYRAMGAIVNVYQSQGR